MAKIVEADDGLPAEVVGEWVRDKHAYLRGYLDISRMTRRKYIGRGNAGATFVDLFCAFGRANIRNTSDFVEGSAVAAWTISAAGEAPFSRLFIADIDDTRRKYCAARLKSLDCPVCEIPGDALAASRSYVEKADPDGLHFAFLDPHNLGALRFEIIETLSKLKRIDMLIHISAMDLQRNLHSQGGADHEEETEFDAFAPGWRKKNDFSRIDWERRRQVLEHWKGLVSQVGMQAFGEAPLIRGTNRQPLYWLMMISRHRLAEKFWAAVSRAGTQRTLF